MRWGLLLLFPTALAATMTHPIHFEAEEENALDETCVAEALRGEETSRCPLVWTGFSYPSFGIRILDDFVVSLNAGTNTQYASGGALPPVIFGRTIFRAYYGYFEDSGSLSGTMEMNYSKWSPYTPLVGNEWIPLSGGEIVTYIEPGSRPGLYSSDPVDPYSPDVRYRLAGGYYEPSPPYEILFLDGSLLWTLRATTVTEAILSPSPDGSLPYTPSETSLVDVDDYVALLDTPLSPILKAVALPFLENSPCICIVGYTARVHPLGPTGTPLDPFLSTVDSRLFAPYPREWKEGSGSTDAGRYDEYVQTYTPWIDLLPLYGCSLNPQTDFYTRGGPLWGLDERGEQGIGPGCLTFAIWTGVWKDLNGDGFVGSAPPDDPYEGGSNPLPDDYLASRGEFFGYVPPPQSPSSAYYTFNVTITPLEGWGPLRPFSSLPFYFFTTSPGPGETCLPYSGSTYLCLGAVRWVEGGGFEPIRIQASSDFSHMGLSRTPSLYLVGGSWMSGAFRACTDPIPLRYVVGGVAREELVWDCDIVGKWDPLRSIEGG